MKITIQIDVQDIKLLDKSTQLYQQVQYQVQKKAKLNLNEAKRKVERAKYELREALELAAWAEQDKIDTDAIMRRYETEGVREAFID